jgi:hypothetical protein
VVSTGRRPTLERRPPPLPTRDADGQAITATHVLVAQYDTALADPSDRCLQHCLVKADAARHENELRRVWKVVNNHSERLAAIKPWVTLVASVGAAVIAAIAGRLV